MTAERKGLLMSAILTYLGNEVRKFNTEKVKQNLYQAQKTFDYGTEWITLAFLPDADIEMIATKILG